MAATVHKTHCVSCVILIKLCADDNMDSENKRGNKTEF